MSSKIATIGILTTITALIVISFFSIDFYINFQAKRSQRGIPVKFIDGATIYLDQRLKQQAGSWSLDLRMHNPKAVQLVFDAIQQMLDHKKTIVVMDVGANSGSVALLPTLSKKIKVFAFDPNIQVADMLRSNVVLNDLSDNVTVIPIGLSNKTALLRLHIPGQAINSGYATFADKILTFNKQQDSSNASQGTTMAALVEPLDLLTTALLQDGEQVDLIKIDTEGWEYFVLEGARETIARYKPRLFINYNPTLLQQAGVEPEKIQKFLKKFDYQCRLFGTQDLWCQHALT